MTTQLQLPASTTTPRVTPAPVRRSRLASLRASLRNRRADRSELARAIASYPATRSALVLPVGAMSRVDTR